MDDVKCHTSSRTCREMGQQVDPENVKSTCASLLRVTMKFQVNWDESLLPAHEAAVPADACYSTTLAHCQLNNQVRSRAGALGKVALVECPGEPRHSSAQKQI